MLALAGGDLAVEVLAAPLAELLDRHALGRADPQHGQPR